MSSSWTKQLGSFLSDSGNDVTTDSSGNIYVTGNTGGDLDGNTNIVMVIVMKENGKMGNFMVKGIILPVMVIL
jgi:hypothetical protein